MITAKLEHVNVTVSNAHRTADMLSRLFGWQIRWQGQSALGGYTIHIGDAETYLAIYMVDGSSPGTHTDNMQRGGLNHVGVIVDDLDTVERRVEREGLRPTAHADYEPGRRFYFHDHDDIEYEVVSYR